MSAPDGTLRGTAVNLSIFNPQTNNYENKGVHFIIANRKNGNITIIIIDSQKKPITAIPANQQIDWIIQNKIYVTFVDLRKIRFLIQFQKPAEITLFTGIAFSAKLSQENKPISIIDSGGAQIDPSSNNIIVNSEVYDLQQPKIETYIDNQQNYSISSSDSTPLNILRSIQPKVGSTYLVPYPNNSFSIVSIISSTPASSEAPESENSPSEPPQTGVESSQESIPQESETIPESTPEAKPEPANPPPENQVEKTDDTDSNPTPKALEKTTEKPPLKAETTTEKSTTKPKAEEKSVKKHVKKPRTEIFLESQPQNTAAPLIEKPTEAPKPAYDAQLQQIKDEMDAKFDELTRSITEMRRAQISVSPLSSDLLVNSVQRLLRENQQKERLIAEKQQLIDNLKERKADTREKDTLREQLAELSRKLAVQKDIARNREAEQKSLQNEIEDLQKKILKTKSDSEEHLAKLKLELEEEKRKQEAELDESRQQLKWNVKSAEDNLQKLKEQFDAAMRENKELKTQTSRDIAGELAKMKAAMPNLVENTVRNMVTGVYKLVSDNFDAKTEYDGNTVMKAISIALQRQAETLLQSFQT